MYIMPSIAAGTAAQARVASSSTHSTAGSSTARSTPWQYTRPAPTREALRYVLCRYCHHLHGYRVLPELRGQRRELVSVVVGKAFFIHVAKMPFDCRYFYGTAEAGIGLPAW